MAGVIRNLIILSVLYPVMTQAAIYTCKDASGRTLTADRPIPECATRAMREYSDRGVLKREIPAPLTTEQKRELEAQRRQQQAAEAALLEQRRSDRALLIRFRDEQDIEAARQRESAVLADLIVQQKAALHVARNDWRQAKGHTPRQTLAAERMQEMTASILDSENDLEKLQAKYDGILRRYRELDSKISER